MCGILGIFPNVLDWVNYITDKINFTLDIKGKYPRDACIYKEN